MTIYRLIWIIGDSNNGTGSHKATNGADSAGARINEWTAGGAISAVTAEPLYMAGSAGSTYIGPHVAFARHLRDQGIIGASEEILIVNCAHAGTGFTNVTTHWSNLDNPSGNPGTALSSAVTRANAALTAAKSSNSLSRPLCIVCNEGANNSSAVYDDPEPDMAGYDAQRAAMHDYIRANLNSEWLYNIPWLEIAPPYQYSVGGPQFYYWEGQLAYKQAIASHMEHAVYVDAHASPVLKSLSLDGSTSNETSNHYSAAAFRGSIGDNDHSDVLGVTYTVEESLAWRMYLGYKAARRRKSCTIGVA